MMIGVKDVGSIVDKHHIKARNHEKYADNLIYISNTPETDKRELKNSKNKGEKPIKTTYDLIDWCGVVW